MSWEGALEGRDGDAFPEGSRHRGLRRGIAPGLDGPLQVGPRLLGSETILQPVAQAVECAGGRERE